MEIERKFTLKSLPDNLESYLSVSLIYFALKKIRDVNISKQCGSSLYPSAYPGCLP